MSLSDSLWAAPRLWIPAPRSGCPHPGGYPRFLGQVLALCFPASVRLPPHGGTGHSLLPNEAESDSLYAAAHGFARVRLRRLGSLHPAPTGLHVERAITWWTPFIPLDQPGLSWQTH